MNYYRLKNIHYIFLSLSVIILAVLSLSFPLSHYIVKKHVAEDKRHEIVRIIRASHDLKTFPTISDSLNIGKRLLEEGLISGLVVYDAAGTEQGWVGSHPKLDYALFQNAKMIYKNIKTGNTEILINVEETGLATPLIVAYNNEQVSSLLDNAYAELALYALPGLGIIIVLMIIFINIVLLKPIKKVTRAIIGALDNPDQADNFQLNWGKKNEIGYLSDQLDLLLSAISVLQNNFDAQTLRALNKIGIGTVSFGRTGALISCNDLMMDLFESSDDREGIITLEFEGEQFQFNFDGMIDSEQDWHKIPNWNICRISVGNRDVSYFVATHSIWDKKQMPTGITLLFVPTEIYQEKVDVISNKYQASELSNEKLMISNKQQSILNDFYLDHMKLCFNDNEITNLDINLWDEYTHILDQFNEKLEIKTSLTLNPKAQHNMNITGSLFLMRHIFMYSLIYTHSLDKKVVSIGVSVEQAQENTTSLKINPIFADSVSNTEAVFLSQCQDIKNLEILLEQQCDDILELEICPDTHNIRFDMKNNSSLAGDDPVLYQSRENHS